MGIKFSSKNTRRLPINSDINITPLVDVILVLLIIFMVTSPMLVAGIKVDLPKSETNNIADTQEPISITITANNKLYLQDTPINQKDLLAKLKAITKENQNLIIYIKADQKIVYGKMMEIVSLVNKAGYSKIGLLTVNQK
jgi:biopolymer transport protein TolR